MINETTRGAPAPLFNIVLHNPEIPGNTGSIGRTCVGLGVRLHLIHPLGFDLSEKAVRRAGLDYWKYADIIEHQSFEDFLINEKITNNESLIFFSRFKQDNLFYKAPYKKNCYLIFGSETKGLPEYILRKYENNCYGLPLYSEHIRSLNLSNTATAAAYECLRQLL
jgi:tRNA (cytidine/uridine-2'-O-)-methyltransferase